MSSTAWWANGATISIRGGRPGRAIASMAAAPPTTRGSTASTWRRCAPCARRAAAGSASMPNSSSRPARRSDRRICVRCANRLRDELKADLFLASDGPRLSADRPTIFLGCRGGLRIHLDVNLRDGAHHSGNWGGVLANPATILASAIATLVDGHGRLLLDELKPPRHLQPDPRGAGRRQGSSRRKTSRRCRRIGARRACRRPSGSMPGTRWKCWRCRRAISISRPMPFRDARRPCCNFALSSAPGSTRSSMRSSAACTNVVFRWSRCRASAELCRIANRFRQPLDQLGGGVDPEDHGKSAGGAAEFRRLAAQRRVFRRARPADDLGAALLSRLLPARARRAHSVCRSPKRRSASWRACSGISASCRAPVNAPGR